jgi:Tol biopolymer transport system component
VYRSSASNIVAGASPGNGMPNLFLYDQSSGTTTLLTASRFGSYGADNRSLTPAFSRDGQTLVFQSCASDLAAGDFNHSSDIFACPFFYVTLTPGANPNVGPTLSWPVIPGLTYHVQFKNQLSDANWQEMSSPLVVGIRGYFSDLTSGCTQRFYRVVAY